MQHFIFYKKHKPFVGIPVSSVKVSFSAIECVPNYTAIRKVFKLYMYLKVGLSYVFSLNGQRVGGVLKKWFMDQRENDKLNPVFIWSLVAGRERYYIHILDKNGNKKQFVKITTKACDYHLLENEKNKLEYYSKAKTFRTPTVYGFNKNNNYCSLSVSYIDDNYRLFHPESNIFPEKISNEISKDMKMLSIGELRNKQWSRNSVRFNNLLQSVGNNYLVKVSTVHGDFGSENIFLNSETNDFMIIDWENSTDNSPFLTDKVAYWLGANYRLLKNNDSLAYNSFCRDFGKFKKIDIDLALLFLTNAKFDLAYLIVKKWQN